MTAWDLGRVSEAASAADDAIFHVLATARANCHVKMTDAQLFGPDPAREHTDADEQVDLADEPAEPVEAAEPVDTPAPDEESPSAEAEQATEAEPAEEPTSAEAEQATDAEPPTEHGATGAARPRRPIHAV